MSANPKYRHIIVLGGHKLSVSYVEKIALARQQGRIAYERIFCVTDDVTAYAHGVLPAEDIIPQAPADFIRDYATQPARQDLQRDTLIPDHTARHVMLETFLKIARERQPDATITLSPFQADFATPFLYKSEADAVWAMSHATWTCPPYCDEPAECPHIKAPRHWNLGCEVPEMLRTFPDVVLSKHVFRCQSLVDEIAQIPMADIAFETNAYLQRLTAATGSFKVLVATVSHCHGILGQFEMSR